MSRNSPFFNTTIRLNSVFNSKGRSIDNTTHHQSFIFLLIGFLMIGGVVFRKNSDTSCWYPFRLFFFFTFLIEINSKILVISQRSLMLLHEIILHIFSSCPQLSLSWFWFTNLTFTDFWFCIVMSYFNWLIFLGVFFRLFHLDAFLHLYRDWCSHFRECCWSSHMILLWTRFLFYYMVLLP